MHNICQNIWYPILINLIFEKISTADIVMRYAVQKSVNLLNPHAKHWHRYCNMMLYQCFKRNVLYTNGKFTRLQLLGCSKIFLKYRMRVEKAPVQERTLILHDDIPYSHQVVVVNAAIITRVSGNISIYVLSEEKASYEYYFKTDLL